MVMSRWSPFTVAAADTRSTPGSPAVSAATPAGRSRSPVGSVQPSPLELGTSVVVEPGEAAPSEPLLLQAARGPSSRNAAAAATSEATTERRAVTTHPATPVGAG